MRNKLCFHNLFLISPAGAGYLRQPQQADAFLNNFLIGHTCIHLQLAAQQNQIPIDFAVYFIATSLRCHARIVSGVAMVAYC